MSKCMLSLSVVAMLAAGAGAASATPLAHALAIQKAAGTDVVPVWGRGFWWGFGPAVVGGAVVGGALATAPYYGPYPYYYGPPVAYGPGYYPAPGYADNAAAACASRYKSYDPSTGTFLGYDGQRHPCP